MGTMFTNFDSTFGEGYYSGIPSGDGGTDILHNGSVVDHYHPQALTAKNGNMVMQTPNADGGQDTIVNGKLVQSTHPNVHGGEDIYHGTKLHQTTMPNAFDGVDIYGENMQLQGMTMPNVFGSEDYLSIHGNADTILNYQDPLAHSSEYRMDPFNVGKFI